MSAVRCVVAALSYAFLLALTKSVPRYDCIAFVVFVFFIFRELRHATPRMRTIAVHLVTQVFLLGFLVHLWTIGYEGRNAVFGGILPWSDSHDYYEDSLRLVHGGRFWEVGSKRPLFCAALAFLLRVTGGSLRSSLLVSALVAAWAVALAALEVWKTHGWKAALVVYFVLVFLERRWTGFVQTEHLGLPLGAIGFALVWRAHALRDDRLAHVHARRYVLAGIFALTMGLVARAGSFFVLPALGIWASRTFLPRDRLRRASFLALAAATVIAGFAVNESVLALAGSGVTFSDYPGIVYGLMHGEDFTYLGERHPEITALIVGERVPAMWKVIFDEAKAQPSLVLYGLGRSAGELFASPYGIFSYVWTNPDDHVLESASAVRASMDAHGVVGPLVLWNGELGTYSLLNAGAMGLLAGSLVLATAAAVFVIYWRRRDDPSLSLVRWSTAGILVSSPFLPPWITSGQQTQTATMPFLAALPAVVFLADAGVLASLCAPVRSWRACPLGLAAPAFAGVLVATVAWHRLAPESTPTCAAGDHVVRVFASTGIEVAVERSRDWRTNAERDLRTSIPFLAKHNPEMTSSFEPYLRPGTRYFSAFDACERDGKILVDDARVLPESPSSRAWTPIHAAPLATSKILHLERPASDQASVP